MTMWLSRRQLERLQPGYLKTVECPIPTQVVSSGECLPPPQTRQQTRVEGLIQDRAARCARRQGMGRRAYLRSHSGMAVAFLAMNDVFGDVFDVDPDEAEDQAAAQEHHDLTRDGRAGTS